MMFRNMTMWTKLFAIVLGTFATLSLALNTFSSAAFANIKNTTALQIHDELQQNSPSSQKLVRLFEKIAKDPNLVAEDQAIVGSSLGLVTDPDFWQTTFGKTSPHARSHLLESLIIAKSGRGLNAFSAVIELARLGKGDPEVLSQLARLVIEQPEFVQMSDIRSEWLANLLTQRIVAEIDALSAAIRNLDEDALEDFRDPHYMQLRSVLFYQGQILRIIPTLSEKFSRQLTRSVLQMTLSLVSAKEEFLNSVYVLANWSRSALLSLPQISLSAAQRKFTKELTAKKWSLGPNDRSRLEAERFGLSLMLLNQSGDEESMTYWRQLKNQAQTARGTVDLYTAAHRLLQVSSIQTLPFTSEDVAEIFDFADSIYLKPEPIDDGFSEDDDGAQRAFLFVFQTLANEVSQRRAQIRDNPFFAGLVQIAFQLKQDEHLILLYSALGALEFELNPEQKAEATEVVHRWMQDLPAVPGRENATDASWTRTITDFKKFLSHNKIYTLPITSLGRFENRAQLGQCNQTLQ